MEEQEFDNACNENDNNAPYISIDSDVLRTLAFLKLLKDKLDYVDCATCKSPLVRLYGQYLLALLKRMQKGEIRLLIVPTIYHENKHSATVMDFVKQFCYFTKDMDVNADKEKEADVLAHAYCSQYETQYGLQPAPIQAVYNSHAKKLIPPNDAYALAESVIESCSLLTINGKDLTFNPKNKTAECPNDRTRGVVCINYNMGYYNEEDGDGKNFTIPKPIHISLFAKRTRFGYKNFELPTPNEDNFIKADRVLE